MKSLILLSFCLLVSLHLYAQDLMSGLVAYYPFNGNANDESGNTIVRNGTVIGAVLTTDRFGQANKAYTFNGVNNYIRVPNWQTVNGNSQRTISLWFKMPNPVTPRVMVFWGAATTNQQSWLGYTNNTQTGIHYFGYEGYYNACWLQNRLDYFNDRWHHLVFTYDGTTKKLWVDATLQATANNSPFNTATTELFIGSQLGSYYFHQGQLDDIRIYNRGLTDSDVIQLYQSESPPPTTEFAKIGSNRFIHTIGQYNTSIGNMAGNAISSGTNNTFTGYQTGRDNSSGSFNTFMGYRAGYQATTGNNNIFLGANANPVGANATSLQNSVALGANAKVAVSDAIVLGDTANTNIKVGIGTASPRFPLDVKGNINIRKGSNGVGKLLFASKASLHSDEQQYVVLTGGKAGESGLRFANLTNDVKSTSTASQFLSLDEQGRVGLYNSRLFANQVQLQVSKSGQWADYVFSANYPLMTINQLGQYIDIHHHLPHLPSAQKMVEQGASMEDLVKSLVKTQEEQALYILQLQKQIDKLRRSQKQPRVNKSNKPTR